MKPALVPRTGIEPAQYCYHWILSQRVYQPACRQAGSAQFFNFIINDLRNSFPTPDFKYFSRFLAACLDSYSSVNIISNGL